MPAKFFTGLRRSDIAEQIASLLNTHNDLSFKRTPIDVQDGSTNYIVETHGNLLLGCCGFEKVSPQLTEIKHLVVRPDWRIKGVGKFLARRAFESAETPIVYATVREDNKPSLKLFRSMGFQDSVKYETGKHNVILLARVNPKWSQAKPDWKSLSSDA